MEDRRIRILFSGDFAPINRYENLTESDQKKLASQMENFGEFDYHVTNLECPITSQKKPISKIGPALKAKPSGLKALLATRTNLVCMANNHIKDFGTEGIAETQLALKRNGIMFVGAGSNEFEARKITNFNIKDKKIAVINYCEQEFSVATQFEAGSNHINPVHAFYDIQQAKSSADYILVIYHGGVEYNPIPSLRIKKLFHYFIDLGASAVISHHSHVYSGFEVYKEKPIYYSLGNFIFDDDKPPTENWNYGMAVKIILDNKTIDSEVFFFKQNQPDIGIHILKDSAKEEQASVFKELSKIISVDNYLEQTWHENIKKNSFGYVKNLLFHKLHRAFLKIGIERSKLIYKNKVIEVQNIIRNESHREVLLYGLEELNKELKHENRNNS